MDWMWLPLQLPIEVVLLFGVCETHEQDLSTTHFTYLCISRRCGAIHELLLVALFCLSMRQSTLIPLFLEHFRPLTGGLQTQRPNRWWFITVLIEAVQRKAAKRSQVPKKISTRQIQSACGRCAGGGCGTRHPQYLTRGTRKMMKFKFHFPCTADHKKNCQSYTVDAHPIESANYIIHRRTPCFHTLIVCRIQVTYARFALCITRRDRDSSSLSLWSSLWSCWLH